MFKVVAKQKTKAYDETICGYFADLEEAQEFAKAVIEHFDKSSVEISYKERIKKEDE